MRIIMSAHDTYPFQRIKNVNKFVINQILYIMKNIAGKFWVIFLIPCLLSGQKMIVDDNFGMNVPLTVMYYDASGVDDSWIGLYKKDADDGSYLQYSYINTNKSGTLSFSQEFETGYYNFRMFQGGGYNKIATSKTFLVRQGMIKDSEFGTYGYLSWNASDKKLYNSAIAIKKLNDGNFIIAGEVKSGRISSGGYEEVFINLTKIDGNGKLIPTFGIGGKVTIQAKSSYFNMYFLAVTALAIQGDGKILIGGNTAVYFSDNDLGHPATIIRFNSNGTIDDSFGDKGVGLYTFKNPGDGPVDAYLRCLESTSDGKIVAAGGNVSYLPYAPGKPVIMRILANGMDDTSFGYTGTRVLTDSIDHRGYIESIIVHPDNSISAIATAEAQFGKNHQIIYNLKKDGAYNTSFGVNGFKLIHYPQANNSWTSKALYQHPMGGLVIVGQNSNSGIWTTKISGISGEVSTSYGENGYSLLIPNPTGYLSLAKANTYGQEISVVYSSLGRRFSMSKILPDGKLNKSFGHSYFELAEQNGVYTELSVNDFIQIAENKYILVGNGKFSSDGHWESMVIGFKNNPEIIISSSEETSIAEKIIDQIKIYPNPCNSECYLAFNLNNSAKISVHVYTLSGNDVIKIPPSFFSAGNQSILFNPDLTDKKLIPGFYIISIQVETSNISETVSRKLVIF